MAKLECLYCGHQFTFKPYYNYDDDPMCPVCRDTHVKEIKEETNDDIYGYYKK